MPVYESGNPANSTVERNQFAGFSMDIASGHDRIGSTDQEASNIVVHANQVAANPERSVVAALGLLADFRPWRRLGSMPCGL